MGSDARGGDRIDGAGGVNPAGRVGADGGGIDKNGVDGPLRLTIRCAAGRNVGGGGGAPSGCVCCENGKAGNCDDVGGWRWVGGSNGGGGERICCVGERICEMMGLDT